MKTEFKRRNQRAQENFRIWYRTPWSKVWSRALTDDVGAGGCMFTTMGGWLWKGMQMEVQMHVGSTVMQFPAQVTRVERYDGSNSVAVRFVEVPHESRHRIEEIVRAWWRALDAARALHNAAVDTKLVYGC